MRIDAMTALLLLTITSGDPQSLATPATRHSAVTEDQQAAAEFFSRIGTYVQLRASIEATLPPLADAEDPAQVRSRERTLAQRIRAARARARQGDIFTSPIAASLRRTVQQEDDPVTWQTIMDENPGPFPRPVNGTYPKTKPLSNMPPNLLLRLPPLPDGLQYRFVGADLILHDTKANLIVDRIPEAISLGRPPRSAVAR
jgi:hypothetical protein